MGDVMAVLKPAVVDTNILIDNPEILLDGKYHYMIPYVVLHELDGLKKNPDLNEQVRRAIKIIHEQQRYGAVTITNLPTAYETNDERIVRAAKKHHATLLTNDIGAMAIAYARGVELPTDDQKDYDPSFTGVRWVETDYKLSANLVGVSELPLHEAETLFGITLQPNEYVGFPHHNDAQKFNLWKRTAGDTVVPVKQTMKPYQTAGMLNFAPLDVYQMAALDAVSDPGVPLTIIEGKVGSGKTLLATAAALSRVQGRAQNSHSDFRKIYVTRVPVPIETSLKLGFLPGEMEQKIAPWLSGFISNLQFLYERTKRDADDEYAHKVFDESFIPLNLESVQGTNIHDSILLVDEYQLLSSNVLKQVLSRIASGSKVVLIGDPGQTYGANRGREGYKKLFPFVAGSPHVSYVRLQHIYRSELTEFVDEVFG